MKISIRVKTNSKRQEITRPSDKEYGVCLKKSPENNKANEELLKLLRKYFKKETKIIRGHTSKNKIIEVKELQ